MVSVIINPGSGPVTDATEHEAIENIKQFVKDCEDQSGITGIQWKRLPGEDSDGRFGFHLFRGEAQHAVEMPGIPLDQVRYVNSAKQNIWHYPRLYVDGSSWVWMYAVLKRRENWEHLEKLPWFRGRGPCPLEPKGRDT